MSEFSFYQEFNKIPKDKDALCYKIKAADIDDAVNKFSRRLKKSFVYDIEHFSETNFRVVFHLKRILRKPKQIIYFVIRSDRNEQ